MRYTILSMILACSAVSVWAGAPLTLVKDGSPESVIIIPSMPNEAAVFGAKELADHIKLITGADVPVITDREAAPSGKIKILIGESKATRKLGLTTKDFKRQEYSLTFLDDAVVLMGWDIAKYPIEKGANFKFGDGKFGEAIVGGWASFGIRDHGFNDDQGTMECFVFKPSSTNEGQTGGVIFSIGDEQNQHRVTAKGELTYETKANGQSQVITVDSYGKLAPGWHHLMCTWDAKANRAEVFIDGKSEGKASYAKTDCAKAERFGVRGGSDMVPYTWGRIDEIRLSNIVRPPLVPAKPHATDENTLALIHLDRNIDGFPYDSSEYPRKSPNADPGDGDNVGTLYAVYDFIEEYLDVHWYFPGDDGRVYDPRKTLTLVGKDVRRSPAMECRSTVGNLLNPADDEWGGVMQRGLYGNLNGDDIRTFSRRLRTGGRWLAANHAFYGYTDRFAIWKANPADERLKGFEEDVALFEKGTFIAQGYDNPSQLCYSSQDTVDYMVKEARKYFDEGSAKPGANVGPDFFALVPNDDCYWCKCVTCQSQLMFPGTESGNKVPDYSQGGESNATFYIWDFTRRVAEELYKSHPDKYIGQLAYIQYLGLPMTDDGKPLELPPNIILGLCLSTRPWLETNPKYNGEQYEYERWMTYAAAHKWKTAFWLYDCFPNETGSKSFYGFNWWPGFHARNLAMSKRMFIKDGVDGLFLCGISDHIDAWLTWQIMYNPDLDVDKALDEFFTRYYGPAAKPMQAFYEGIEKVFTDPNRRYGVKEYLHWSSLGTPPAMREAEKHISEAKKLASEEPWKNRVGRTDTAVWQHMQFGFNTWSSKQAGGKHTWPFVLPDGDKFQTNKRETAPAGMDFLKSVYFRSYANPIGLRDHRFNDRKGTMEAWVWCGPPRAEYCQGLGTIFEIVSKYGLSGHRVYIDLTNNTFKATYETWVDGKTNRVVGHKLAADQWHHVMAVWSAAGEKPAMVMYVDQKKVGAASYKATSCSNAVGFGVAGGGAPIHRLPTKGPGFGPIDEVRLSNVIRKPVKQTAPHKPDAGTLLLMHFDEPEGEVIKDYSGIKR